MRLGNLGGRAVVLTGAGAVDVAKASGGRFGPDVQALYEEWADVRAFGAGIDAALAEPFDEAQLWSPVPTPRQVFAIGLNYRDHAAESGMALPSVPATFTKFPASLSGPFADVELAGPTV